MREKFVYPMQEKVYGWYPPAKGIYRNPKTSNTYMQECLYKHWKSRYNQDNRGVDTPQPPTPVQIQLSPRPVSKSPSRASITSPAVQDRPCSHTSSRPPSTKSFVRPKTSSSTGEFRHRAWATKVPETEITIKSPALSIHSVPLKPPEQPDRTPSTGSRRDRIKSATIHRDRVSAPQRTVKSAGPTRTSVPVSIPGAYPELSAGDGRFSRTVVSAPPPPCVADEEEVLSIPEDESPADDELMEDYETRVKKYGWRMEVHGDPLKLKRFRKRVPYTVKCEVPVIPPNPPTGKMECFDTFFYNTIPRKPLSFTIHQEWMSEVLHAKRMELQKREGINYRYKNFSFAY